MTSLLIMSGEIAKDKGDADKYCGIFFRALETFQENWSVPGVYHLLSTVEVD